MAFLEIDGVCKSFGDREILRDVHLGIERGELVAVLGRSGSGKTTLLSIAAGLVPACRGQVRLGGAPVRRPGRDRAVVFQNYSLLPWMTVHENVRLAARDDDHAERYVELVHLSHARDRRPAQLSGGMRQRVALARALAMEPEVLLMDEPLAALDALTRASLQDEIEGILARDRRTALLVTNDVEEAIRLADRIVPLTVGGTLGEPIAVDLPRPRSRRDPRVQALRAHVVARLSGTMPMPLPAEAAA
jgi:nitrate/nitrite transport system ATP-binding protein